MRIDRCNNIGDFRSVARRRLPGPIFHYIDGAADDEVTYRRNTEAYERCDLVPNVLAGVEIIDMSVTVMGQRLDMPLFCSPTALQRLFHHDGERAVAKAAEKFGTMFGISSLGTVSVEEIGSTIRIPKLFQLYFHKDRGLTNNMIERCIAAMVVACLFRTAGCAAYVQSVNVVFCWPDSTVAAIDQRASRHPPIDARGGSDAVDLADLKRHALELS